MAYVHRGCRWCLPLTAPKNKFRDASSPTPRRAPRGQHRLVDVGHSGGAISPSYATAARIARLARGRAGGVESFVASPFILSGAADAAATVFTATCLASSHAAAAKLAAAVPAAACLASTGRAAVRAAVPAAVPAAARTVSAAVARTVGAAVARTVRAAVARTVGAAVPRTVRAVIARTVGAAVPRTVRTAVAAAARPAATTMVGRCASRRQFNQTLAWPWP